MSKLSDWLEGLGLQSYTSIFEKNGINLQSVHLLTEEDLKEMQVLLGHRRILLSQISGLNQVEASKPAAAAIDHPAPETATHPAEPIKTERRQVTILFADLTGYTRLTNSLDAEELHTILGRFFDSSDAIVVEHGGSVDKHLGDCVMAVFGAPVAHGNDAERAVRAAYKIQESMPLLSRETGQSLQVHIGIASGQVIASGVGNDAHYTVTGESVNLASRLSDAANPGETLISNQVQLSVSNHFELGEQGELEVKGFDTPLQVFMLKGLLSNIHQTAKRPFVGRQSEIKQMSVILESSMQSDAGQVVYIRGEAGIGKTRLMEKMTDFARQAGFDCHRTLVLDFGMSRDQNVLRALLGSLLNIQPNAEPAARQKAADQAIETGLLNSRQRIFLNEMLNLTQPKRLSARYDAMDNATRQQGKLTMVADLICASSEKSAQFILIEDIHWAGNSVLSYLSHIAAAISDSPCVLFLTSRFEGDPLDNKWRTMMAATSFVSIDLKPLRQREALNLAEQYFDTMTQYALDCVERADGNPLFLEQLLRSAEEIGESSVPGSVQSIVQARLDSIQGPDKKAIQLASVLGKRFLLEDLRHMLDDPDYLLDYLIERQLLKPEPEGRAYLFSHALVQEGIYQSILRNVRSEWHRRAAKLYTKTEPELCARHLDRAGDAAAPAAYLRAAQLRYDEQHFEAVLELLEPGLQGVQNQDTKVDMMCLKGNTLRQLGQVEASIVLFEAALSLDLEARQECTALIGLAEGLRIADRQTEALRMMDRAQQIAQSNDIQSMRGYIHYLRGNLHFMLGNIDSCMSEHQQALDYSKKVGSQTHTALAFGGLGDAYYLRGQMRSALDQFNACKNVCQLQGYGRIEVSNRHMAGWCRIFLMQFEPARSDALKAIEMASDVRQQRDEVLGLELAGLIEIEMGLYDEAESHLARALDLARQLQAGNFEAHAQVLIARLAIIRGDLSSAQIHASQAEAIVRKVGMAFIGPTVLTLQAELSTVPKQQQAYLAEAEQLLDSGCVSHNQFWVARFAIDLHLRLENWDTVDRFAQRLEDYTAQQALDWSDFIIARGRCLAARGRGDHGQEIHDRLLALHAQAENAGLMQPGIAITAALKTSRF